MTKDQRVGVIGVGPMGAHQNVDRAAAATLVADSELDTARATKLATEANDVPSSFPAALPQARTPESMSAPPLRWGILGTGWIAERFAAALTASTRQQVYAVGSRSLSTARQFADTVGAPAAYGSYDEMVSDGKIDVVYVATPYNFHHPHAPAGN